MGLQELAVVQRDPPTPIQIGGGTSEQVPNSGLDSLTKSLAPSRCLRSFGCQHVFAFAIVLVLSPFTRSVVLFVQCQRGASSSVSTTEWGLEEAPSRISTFFLSGAIDIDATLRRLRLPEAKLHVQVARTPFNRPGSRCIHVTVNEEFCLPKFSPSSLFFLTHTGSTKDIFMFENGVAVLWGGLPSDVSSLKSFMRLNLVSSSGSALSSVSAPKSSDAPTSPQPSLAPAADSTSGLNATYFNQSRLEKEREKQRSSAGKVDLAFGIEADSEDEVSAGFFPLGLATEDFLTFSQGGAPAPSPPVSAVPPSPFGTWKEEERCEYDASSRVVKLVGSSDREQYEQMYAVSLALAASLHLDSVAASLQQAARYETPQIISAIGFAARNLGSVARYRGKLLRELRSTLSLVQIAVTNPAFVSRQSSASMQLHERVLDGHDVHTRARLLQEQALVLTEECIRNEKASQELALYRIEATILGFLFLATLAVLFSKSKAFSETTWESLFGSLSAKFGYEGPELSGEFEIVEEVYKVVDGKEVRIA